MTTRQVCRLVRIAAVALAPTMAFAQDVQPPQQQRPQIGPAIQKIQTASALSTEPMGAVSGVRELSDGRILVNDILRRRLLLMDTTLHTVKVVLDSLSEVSNTYGTRGGSMIALPGDTTLFIDPVSYAMVVLDGEGKIVRVRSVWRVQDVFYVTSQGGFGYPGLDSKGRIVYMVQAQPAPPKVAPPPGVPWFPEQPDSAFIVGVTLETRKLDTLGVVRIPKSEMRIRQTADNRIMFEEVRNPLPMTDDWAVMSNGTLAFVRGRDYRIEYVQADGSVKSSEKLPYEWQRMTDEDKQHMVDSMKTVMRRQSLNNFTSNMIRWVNMYGKTYPAAFTVPEGFTPPPGMPKDWILPKGVTLPANYMYACPPGVEPTMPNLPPGTMQMVQQAVGKEVSVSAAGGVDVKVVGAAGGRGDVQIPAGAAPGGAAPNANAPRTASCAPAPVVFSGGQAPPPPVISPINVVDPLNLPDYKPPFTQGSVRADADGNLWIRTVQPRPVSGGPVFDIVSPEGELVSRLQIPPGYAIVGFGKGKVVYMSMRDAQGIHLARIRLK